MHDQRSRSALQSHNGCMHAVYIQCRLHHQSIGASVQFVVRFVLAVHVEQRLHGQPNGTDVQRHNRCVLSLHSRCRLRRQRSRYILQHHKRNVRRMHHCLGHVSYRSTLRSAYQHLWSRMSYRQRLYVTGVVALRSQHQHMCSVRNRQSVRSR
jgi:hypothetical protein